jgi:hypothetical protein
VKSIFSKNESGMSKYTNIIERDMKVEDVIKNEKAPNKIILRESRNALISFLFLVTHSTEKKDNRRCIKKG